MKQKTVKFSDMVNTTSQRKALTLKVKALEHHKPENPLNPYSIKITYPLNSRELILRTKTTKRAITEATIKFDKLNGTLTLNNVENEEIAEFCLHEFVEMEITDIIDKLFENVSNIKTEMNVAHFLTAFSLNEYYFIVKLWNPFQNYIECDREADFETETSFPARKESLFGKGQKSGEKLGIRKLREKSLKFSESSLMENMNNHVKNVENLKMNSIPSNRLEIASYGLSVPKTESKRQTKVKEMVDKKSKSKAQDDEQSKNVKAQELVISSKVNVKSKKEAKSMKTETKAVKVKVRSKKAVHKKQRKGKSLLTAFRINRMERRLTLNLARCEIKHGKYI